MQHHGDHYPQPPTKAPATGSQSAARIQRSHEIEMEERKLYRAVYAASVASGAGSTTAASYAYDALKGMRARFD